MSRSVMSWSPTLASVPLLIPKPRLPLPKFVTPVAAKPTRTKMKRPAIMAVPNLDFCKRRKEESIGFRVRLEDDRCFRGRAGAHQAAPLGRSKRAGPGDYGAQETRCRQLEDARPVVGPRRGPGDCRRVARLSAGRCRLVCPRDPDRTR